MILPTSPRPAPRRRPPPAVPLGFHAASPPVPPRRCAGLPSPFKGTGSERPRRRAPTCAAPGCAGLRPPPPSLSLRSLIAKTQSSGGARRAPDQSGAEVTRAERGAAPVPGRGHPAPAPPNGLEMCLYVGQTPDKLQRRSWPRLPACGYFPEIWITGNIRREI